MQEPIKRGLSSIRLYAQHQLSSINKELVLKEREESLGVKRFLHRSLSSKESRIDLCSETVSFLFLFVDGLLKEWKLGPSHQR